MIQIYIQINPNHFGKGRNEKSPKKIMLTFHFMFTIRCGISDTIDSQGIMTPWHYPMTIGRKFPGKKWGILFTQKWELYKSSSNTPRFETCTCMLVLTLKLVSVDQQIQSHPDYIPSDPESPVTCQQTLTERYIPKNKCMSLYPQYSLASQESDSDDRWTFTLLNPSIVWLKAQTSYWMELVATRI